MTGRPPHPGRVDLVDAATGAVLETRTADELGDGAWATDAQGREVPVVRILFKQAGDRQELISLGPEGQFLSSTVRLAPDP